MVGINTDYLMGNDTKLPVVVFPSILEISHQAPMGWITLVLTGYTKSRITAH